MDTKGAVESVRIKRVPVTGGARLYSFPSPILIKATVAYHLRAKQSVHSLGKWYVKFRTGKFRPEIAFIICRNQFHLPQNDRELKPVSKMALKK